MHTLNVDKQLRVRIPDAKPGQVLDYAANADGSFLLTPVRKSEPSPGKVRFIKKNGRTVGQPDRKITSEQVRELMNDLS